LISGSIFSDLAKVGASQRLSLASFFLGGVLNMSELCWNAGFFQGDCAKFSRWSIGNNFGLADENGFSYELSTTNWWLIFFVPSSFDFYAEAVFGLSSVTPYFFYFGGSEIVPRLSDLKLLVIIFLMNFLLFLVLPLKFPVFLLLSAIFVCPPYDYLSCNKK